MKQHAPPTRFGGLALPLLAVALFSSANAATYTLELFSENGSSPGKYTADPDADLEFVLSNYDAKATSDSGNRFWTFCLERTEYFEPGRTYNASDSLQASTGPDPISAGTAYLYEQFATGDLAGFYDNSGGAKLQNTIWALEGEFGVNSLDYLDSGLKGLLETTFGTEAAYLDDYAGSSVGVLNLTKFDGLGGDTRLGGTERQDQLVFWGTPSDDESEDPPEEFQVPDGGTTLLLLGLSLGGLGLCKQRIKKSS